MGSFSRSSFRSRFRCSFACSLAALSPCAVRFCADNGFTGIIRGHEAFSDGWKQFGHSLVIHSSRDDAVGNDLAFGRLSSGVSGEAKASESARAHTDLSFSRDGS